MLFHCKLLILSILLISSPLQAICKLDIVSNSLDGTENVKLNLTDKQLSIQKYLSWLTFLQPANNNKSDPSSKFGWIDWELNYDNDQTNVDSIRYPLAFIGYAAAASVYKTPSYREVGIRIIDNTIQRLLEPHQYVYIEQYWSHLDSFPDPVIYENIMYSGHLAMLIALYESLSGDFKYTEIGWNFTWPGYTSIHYTAGKLMDVIYNQVITQETGGVACEPNSIFVLCNDHPRIAFQLYDAIHGTNYSKSNIKWEKWIKKHARAPDLLPDGDYRFFRIIYYEPIHEWIPFYGTAGNDAWALVFMNGWINDKEFVQEGFKKLIKSTQWKQPADDQEYLNTGIFGRISNLNTWIASSFFPAVESQYSIVKTNKSVNVFNWFEKNFGQFSSILINNCNNTYYYQVADDSYRIHSVANLFLSMIADNVTFIEMYTKPFFVIHKNEPQLVDIDYPNLHVKYAFYDFDTKLLKFGLKTDCFSDFLASKFNVINVDSFKKALLNVNGATYDISTYAKFDYLKRLVWFNNINITYDSLNEFQIYF